MPRPPPPPPQQQQQHARARQCLVAAATVAAAALLPPVVALPNGYGLQPGMGWEGDYGDVAAPGPGRGNASYVAAIADFMATGVVDAGGGRRATLKELGYWYVNPSSSWDEFDRDPATGDLVPSRTLYPDGLQPTVDHIHALGLGYGTYGDRGDLDCDKRPGQLHHEAQDAAYFARVGVDWFKSDSCYDSGDQATAVAHYAAMRDAFNRTGRRVWFALCGWEPWYASRPDAGNVLANSARIGPDTGGGWQAVLKNVDNANGIGQYAGRAEHGGYWNDGSLQLAPGMGCSGGVVTNSSATCTTPARHRSQFHLWAVLGFNLVMTGNLPLIHKLDPFVLQTWANAEVIAINQDAAAWTAERHGRRLDAGGPLVAAGFGSRGRTSGGGASQASTYARAAVAECGGEPALQQWTLGANGTVYNAADNTFVAMKNCEAELIYDGCAFDPLARTCAGQGVYSHFMFSLNATSGLLRSHYDPSLCVTANADDTLSALRCQPDAAATATAAAAAAAPPAANQRWAQATSGGQLTNGANKCLTAAAPAPGPGPHNRSATAVFGRPLTSAASPALGAYAVVLLNNGQAVANVTCDAACAARMGLPAGFPDPAFARDLVAHAPLGPLAWGRGFAFRTDALGATRVVKLCATQAECAAAAAAAAPAAVPGGPLPA